MTTENGEVVIEEEGEEVEYETPPKRTESGGKERTPEEESALQDILDRGSDVDDDEIEEATKRLLSCTLLQDEIDDIWDGSDVDPEQDDADIHDVERSDEHDVEIGEDGDGTDVEETERSTVPVGYGSEDSPTDAPPRQELKSDDAPPNEMTSLLGHEASGSGTSMASQNEELLQPSIFTTVSDIDLQRRMNFN